MKLGFVSAILPDLTLDEVVTFAASAGYRCVELMCWPVGRSERRYAGVTHLDVSAVGPDQVRRTRELLAAASVEISGVRLLSQPARAGPWRSGRVHRPFTQGDRGRRRP